MASTANHQQRMVATPATNDSSYQRWIGQHSSIRIILSEAISPFLNSLTQVSNARVAGSGDTEFGREADETARAQAATSAAVAVSPGEFIEPVVLSRTPSVREPNAAGSVTYSSPSSQGGDVHQNQPIQHGPSLANAEQPLTEGRLRDATTPAAHPRVDDAVFVANLTPGLSPAVDDDAFRNAFPAAPASGNGIWNLPTNLAGAGIWNTGLDIDIGADVLVSSAAPTDEFSEMTPTGVATANLPLRQSQGQSLGSVSAASFQQQIDKLSADNARLQQMLLSLLSSQQQQASVKPAVTVEEESHQDDDDSCSLADDDTALMPSTGGSVVSGVNRVFSPMARKPRSSSSSVASGVSRVFSPMARKPRSSSPTSQFSNLGGLTMAKDAVIAAGGKLFLTREAAAEVVATTGSSPFLDAGIEVKINKFHRIPEGAEGRDEQQKEITKGLKVGHQLGAHAHEVGKIVDKGDRTSVEERAKAYNRFNEGVKCIRKQAAEYDLLFVTDVPTGLKPGISADMSDEELMNTNIDDLFCDEWVCLFNEWGKLKGTESLKLWQRVLTLHPQVLPEDKDSNRLTFQLVRNSCTMALQDSVKKSWEKAFSEPSARGGATYLYTVLCHIYGGARAVTESLKNEITLFSKLGLSMFQGENASLANIHFTENVIRHLYDREALTPEMENEVITGFTLCPNPLMKRLFTAKEEAKLQADIEAKVGDYVLSRTRTQDELYDALKSLFASGEEIYKTLIQNRQWVSASGKSLVMKAAAIGSENRLVGIICFNCGGNHPLFKCPEPKDQSKIDAAKKKYLEEKAKKSEARKSGIPERGVSGTTSGKKDWRVNPNDSAKVQFKCCHKDCSSNGKGRWGNHSTKYHTAAKEKGGSFSMLDERPQHAGSKKQKEINANAAGTSSSGGSRSNSKPSKADFEAYNKKRSDLEKVISQHGEDSEVGRSAFNNLQKLNAEFQETNFQ